MLRPMNKLSTEERKQVVGALVEGNSLRSITRMTGVHRTTVMKLLCDLGLACSEYQDKAFRALHCKRIQCDEVWSFVGAKEKNCTAEMKAKGAGDVWTWIALDPDSRPDRQVWNRTITLKDTWAKEAKKK